MLTHIVLFKFKPETTQDQVDRLTEGLGALPAQIAEIQEFRFGRDLIRSERSYDLGLISGFADLDAMQRYQVHPEHQKVVTLVKQIASSVVAVDFEE
ncbi:MAG: stress responsive alpha-beta barrel domain-containing protein [Desulfuromonas sp.]|nr:MAG: stress responsive alpha-beta barrel domain-containing protein [Desulfuromonas sp.]